MLRKSLHYLSHQPQRFRFVRSNGLAKRFAKASRIAPDRFEFQLLCGVRRALQDQLAHKGWRVRVYVPFGTQWYPYLMRRP